MNFVQVILFAATLYNLVLVVLILVRTRTHQAGGSFAWYILSTAAWTAATAIMQFSDTGPALILCRATFLFACCITISWIWFCADFPVPSKRFRLVAWIITLLTLPWLYYSMTDAIIISVTPKSWGMDAVSNLAGLTAFMVWSEASCGIGAIHLFYKARRVRGIDRLQVRYILLGFLGLVIFGGFTNMLLPAITHTSRYAPLGPLSSLFVTTTTTYAIVRYRLMDIKIVLRAGLIYSVTIGTLSLLFALIVPILDSTLKAKFHFPNLTGSFLLAFLMALAFQPLRRYVQNIVDQRFFKSVYDYRLTLREAGSALASVHDRELLVQTLVTALARTLRPRGIAVFLPGDDKQLNCISVTDGWTELPQCLPSVEPVVTHIIETDDVLLSEELVRQAEQQHQIGQRMKSWNAYVLIPLIAGERLCGLVFLGEKLSGDVYTTDDIALLRILGKQAAIALDNARHYDEVVEMNEYHQRLLEIMQDGLIALDPQGRIITFNPAAEDITGVPATKALGQRLDALGLTQLPFHDTGGQAVETTLTTRAGAEVPILVSVTPFLRRWDVTPSRMLVFRDLSVLRALEQEKMQAERFSSMGAMAASLAHEIKNPLVPIQTFAHLLPTRYDDAEFRDEFSVMVVKEVDRINRLVGQMLDLVRKPSHDRSPVDVQEVVERLLALVRPECERHGITVVTDFADHVPTVVGVAGQIYQAILNVLTNAVQAMEDGGVLTVSLHATDQDLICRITDTGPGVSEEHLTHIFEPLYTTKAGGHGLGLALTYQFVRSHGGELRAECQPGSGLTILMVLPAWRHLESDLLCT